MEEEKSILHGEFFLKTVGTIGSIVNKVIRGNFTSIKSIKSIKGQASDFLPLRCFMCIAISSS